MRKIQIIETVFNKMNKEYKQWLIKSLHIPVYWVIMKTNIALNVGNHNKNYQKLNARGQNIAISLPEEILETLAVGTDF